MKKLKIKKKYLADIHFIRQLIEHNHNYQDMLVNKIAKDMGITDDADLDILWDHIYNGTEFSVEIVENKRR